MHKKHRYTIGVKWTGDLGQGTSAYDAYSRDHEIKAMGKVMIPGSSDPSFRGSKERYNPEELFLSSIASCHMLWYLHLCTQKGITVLDYEDAPEGTMREEASGRGYFDDVMLKPNVRIKEGDDMSVAKALHREANHYCFIANSLNIRVTHESIVRY